MRQEKIIRSPKRKNMWKEDWKKKLIKKMKKQQRDIIRFGWKLSVLRWKMFSICGHWESCPDLWTVDILSLLLLNYFMKPMEEDIWGSKWQMSCPKIVDVLMYPWGGTPTSLFPIDIPLEGSTPIFLLPQESTLNIYLQLWYRKFLPKSGHPPFNIW